MNWRQRRRAVVFGWPVLLPSLGGCYVAPQDAGYGDAQPGYPAGAYARPGYQTAPSGYDPYASYPGYTCNDGAPTFNEGGAPVPLILYGGCMCRRIRGNRATPLGSHRRANVLAGHLYPGQDG